MFKLKVKQSQISSKFQQQMAKPHSFMHFLLW